MLGSGRPPLHRKESTMRVFIAMDRYLNSGAHFFVGCFHNEERLKPVFIGPFNIFYYPEFWIGCRHEHSAERRKRVIVASCRDHAGGLAKGGPRTVSSTGSGPIASISANRPIRQAARNHPPYGNAMATEDPEDSSRSISPVAPSYAGTNVLSSIEQENPDNQRDSLRVPERMYPGTDNRSHGDLRQMRANNAAPRSVQISHEQDRIQFGNADANSDALVPSVPMPTAPAPAPVPAVSSNCIGPIDLQGVLAFLNQTNPISSRLAYQCAEELKVITFSSNSVLS